MSHVPVPSQEEVGKIVVNSKNVRCNEQKQCSCSQVKVIHRGKDSKTYLLANERFPIEISL